MCSAAGPSATALKQSAHQAGCVTFATLTEIESLTSTSLKWARQPGRAPLPSLEPLLEPQARSSWGLKWTLPQAKWKAFPSSPGTEDGAGELLPTSIRICGCSREEAWKHHLWCRFLTSTKFYTGIEKSCGPGCLVLNSLTGRPAKAGQLYEVPSWCTHPSAYGNWSSCPHRTVHW